MYTVTLQDQTLSAREGELISELLQRAGIFHDHPCGGRGTCGKCRVVAFGGLSAPSQEEKRHLSESELAAGVRLSCMARITGNAALRLPRAEEQFRTGKKLSVLSLSPDPTAFPGQVGLAADIGTTTVAIHFFRLDTGALLYSHTGLNLQRAFGADVISRLDASSTPEGLAALAGTVRSQLSEGVSAFTAHCGIPAEQIIRGSIAANTAMLHFLAEIPCIEMATAPFPCPSKFGNTLSGRELNLPCGDAEIYLSPCVSAYVGGDITAGMLAGQVDSQPGVTLYLDIGTNGEMILKTPDRLLACATAAGPAFEGAGIRCGTGGIPGAITSLSFGEDGSLSLTTIEDAPPCGICGSGLVSAVAALLDAGLLDETGLLCPEDVPALAHHFIDTEEGPALLLSPAEDIILTGKDIRAYQLAKAAIAAGIDTLLDRAGLTPGQLDRIFLAGGFGSFLDIPSCERTGLLPAGATQKTHSLGNAAGHGAALLLTPSCREEVAALTRRIDYLELSGDPVFSDAFIDRMCF
ncbi:MAG: DUF4445 domain-containing protein [Ruminococcaceae bacterium]|nr:DUF4445 domain-containing protein [Oscillospiraceae bacterium]